MPRQPLRTLPYLLLVAWLPLAAGCMVRRAPTTAVAPLQLFGDEPSLMPQLAFDPAVGVLTVSAMQPVYVTVLEVDPATQARAVLFPEAGRRPLRVSGDVALGLRLQSVAGPRGLLVIASADSLVVAQEDRTVAGGSARWQVPDQMPAAWAAVYLPHEPLDARTAPKR